MAVLKGWQRVDQSTNPTVPRGVVEGLFDEKLLDRERRQRLSELPHSKQLAEDWAGDTWGHKAPVNLTKRGDIQKALKVPEVMVLQGSKATDNDVFRVYSASGLLVPKGDLGKFASQTEKRQHLTVALQHQNHTQLAQHLQKPVPSWQTNQVASAPALRQDLGGSAPLPTTFGGGGVPEAGQRAPSTGSMGLKLLVGPEITWTMATKAAEVGVAAGGV